MTPRVRVVLAEDGALLREGLSALLCRIGFDVLAAVPDASTLEAEVDRNRPDLIVTDVRMPPGYSDEGLRAAVRIRNKYGPLPVVALSQYVERSYAGHLLDSCGGEGVGYLLKDRVTAITHFTTSLNAVAAGATIIDPDVVRQLIRRPDPVSRLSTRELQVLALMAEGHSNSAMAQHLHLSEAAITKHTGNILAKLDLPPSDDTNRRVLAVLTYLRRR